MHLEDLLAEREIYRKLVGFARAMDDREWDKLNDITTDDIKSNVGMGPKEGRDAFVEVMRQFLDTCGTTQHMLANVLIDIKGDTAISTADVADMHLGKGRKKKLSFRTLGRYTDKWVKIDGRWLMCERAKENRANVGTLRVFSISLKTALNYLKKKRAGEVS